MALKINFKLEEKSRIDKLFLRIEYMSGDASASEYQEIELNGIPYSDWKNHLEKIEETVNKYKLIADLTDINDIAYETEYDVVLAKYGEEIAHMFENVPGDVTCEGEKSCLRSVELIGYDENGNCYKSYL